MSWLEMPKKRARSQRLRGLGALGAARVDLGGGGFGGLFSEDADLPISTEWLEAKRAKNRSELGLGGLGCPCDEKKEPSMLSMSDFSGLGHGEIKISLPSCPPPGQAEKLSGMGGWWRPQPWQQRPPQNFQQAQFYGSSPSQNFQAPSTWAGPFGMQRQAPQQNFYQRPAYSAPSSWGGSSFHAFLGGLGGVSPGLADFRLANKKARELIAAKDPSAGRWVVLAEQACSKADPSDRGDCTEELAYTQQLMAGDTAARMDYLGGKVNLAKAKQNAVPKDVDAAYRNSLFESAKNAPGDASAAIRSALDDAAGAAGRGATGVLDRYFSFMKVAAVVGAVGITTYFVGPKIVAAIVRARATPKAANRPSRRRRIFS